MLIYEVNLEVAEEIRAEYRDWLESHIQAMLALPGFLSARIFQDRDPPGHWVVHYSMTGPEALDQYLDVHAPVLRAEGRRRFGDQFRAWRRVLLPAD